MTMWPNQPVAGANAYWRCQFRDRGSRRESAAAQLFLLGHIHTTLIMKRTLILLLTSLFLTLYSSSADDTKSVTNIIDFQGASPSLILTFYQKLSGCELVIDSRVKTVDSQIVLRIVGEQMSQEVLKQIREALLKQARIVITRLDDKRESVTFNDALPLAK